MSNVPRAAQAQAAPGQGHWCLSLSHSGGVQSGGAAPEAAPKRDVALDDRLARSRRGGLGGPPARADRYTWPTAAADRLGGITVGFVALPLAIAFAKSHPASRLRAGLYCAILAGS